MPHLHIQKEEILNTEEKWTFGLSCARHPGWFGFIWELSLVGKGNSNSILSSNTWLALELEAFQIRFVNYSVRLFRALWFSFFMLKYSSEFSEIEVYFPALLRSRLNSLCSHERCTGKEALERCLSIYSLPRLSYLVAKWLNWVSGRSSCHCVRCMTFSWGDSSCVVCPIFKLRSECRTQALPWEHGGLTKPHTVSSMEMPPGTCHSATRNMIQAGRSALQGLTFDWAKMADPPRAQCWASLVPRLLMLIWSFAQCRLLLQTEESSLPSSQLCTSEHGWMPAHQEEKMRKQRKSAISAELLGLACDHQCGGLVIIFGCHWWLYTVSRQNIPDFLTSVVVSHLPKHTHTEKTLCFGERRCYAFNIWSGTLTRKPGLWWATAESSAGLCFPLTRL